jgi:hypothetical protein
VQVVRAWIIRKILLFACPDSISSLAEFLLPRSAMQFIYQTASPATLQSETGFLARCAYCFSCVPLRLPLPGYNRTHIADTEVKKVLQINRFKMSCGTGFGYAGSDSIS